MPTLDPEPLNLQGVTPEEVTERVNLLVSFLLENDFYFQKVNNDQFIVNIPTYKKVSPNFPEANKKEDL